MCISLVLASCTAAYYILGTSTTRVDLPACVLIKVFPCRAPAGPRSCLLFLSFACRLPGPSPAAEPRFTEGHCPQVPSREHAAFSPCRWRWTPRRRGIARGPRGSEVCPCSRSPGPCWGHPRPAEAWTAPSGRLSVAAPGGLAVKEKRASLLLSLQFPWSRPSRSCSGQWPAHARRGGSENAALARVCALPGPGLPCVSTGPGPPSGAPE